MKIIHFSHWLQGTEIQIKQDITKTEGKGVGGRILLFHLTVQLRQLDFNPVIRHFHLSTLLYPISCLCSHSGLLKLWPPVASEAFPARPFPNCSRESLKKEGGPSLDHNWPGECGIPTGQGWATSTSLRQAHSVNFMEIAWFENIGDIGFPKENLGVIS